jgi:phytoene dehydrogenase-like protein
MSDDTDVVVIGAGFGGLAAALQLAEQGVRVTLCEALNYPGGCASTFDRDGYRFESGATLLSGLAPEQLFGRWIARYQPSLELDWMDPLLELRTSSVMLSVRRDRQSLLSQLCSLPGAPIDRLHGFFDRQRRVAAVMWELLDKPELMPEFALRWIPRALPHHLRMLPRYLALLPLISKPMGTLLDESGLGDFIPLRVYLDALCQITLQCSSAVAEAPLVFSAMDYYYRGTAHVVGGVGAMANVLLDSCRQRGVDVQLACKVKHVQPDRNGWVVHGRRGKIRAKAVACNLLPSALPALMGDSYRSTSHVAALEAGLTSGWSAAMLYRVVTPPIGSHQSAHHIELVADENMPFCDGNHVFMSISGANERDRCPPGQRTMTVSTHIPIATVRDETIDQAQYIAAVQQRMRSTIALRAPEWSTLIHHELTGSARTFARFVGRQDGAVGGAPRTAGLHNYQSFSPVQAAPRLWLVGDSVFPGQSALAAATGGVRAANAIFATLR